MDRKSSTEPSHNSFESVKMRPKRYVVRGNSDKIIKIYTTHTYKHSKTHNRKS